MKLAYLFSAMLLTSTFAAKTSVSNKTRPHDYQLKKTVGNKKIRLKRKARMVKKVSARKNPRLLRKKAGNQAALSSHRGRKDAAYNKKIRTLHTRHLDDEYKDDGASSSTSYYEVGKYSSPTLSSTPSYSPPSYSSSSISAPTYSSYTSMPTYNPISTPTSSCVSRLDDISNLEEVNRLHTAFSNMQKIKQQLSKRTEIYSEHDKLDASQNSLIGKRQMMSDCNKTGVADVEEKIKLAKSKLNGPKLRVLPEDGLLENLVNENQNSFDKLKAEESKAREQALNTMIKMQDEQQKLLSKLNQYKQECQPAFSAIRIWSSFEVKLSESELGKYQRELNAILAGLEASSKEIEGLNYTFDFMNEGSTKYSYAYENLTEMISSNKNLTSKLLMDLNILSLQLVHSREKPMLEVISEAIYMQSPPLKQLAEIEDISKLNQTQIIKAKQDIMEVVKKIENTKQALSSIPADICSKYAVMYKMAGDSIDRIISQANNLLQKVNPQLQLIIRGERAPRLNSNSQALLPPAPAPDVSGAAAAEPSS